MRSLLKVRRWLRAKTAAEDDRETMQNPSRLSVLLVCMGNICRSPTAHGVLRKLIREEGLEDCVEVSSAGTHAFHVGESPDPRATQAARSRGVDISDLRARMVRPDDLLHFDYVLAMDRENYEVLRDLCPDGYERRVRLFLDFAPQLAEREVPDPYFGGARGFERVLDMVELASKGLLSQIREDLKGQ